MKISTPSQPNLFGTEELNELISSPSVSHARTFRWPGTELDSVVIAVLSSGRRCDLPKLFNRLGWSRRTFQVYVVAGLPSNHRRHARYVWEAPENSEAVTAVNGMWKRKVILRLSSLHFGNAGIWGRSELLTGSGTEWPSDGAACSLSDVLESSVSPRFSLSSQAATGILRRAAARGKRLPGHLEEALESVAGAAIPKE